MTDPAPPLEAYALISGMNTAALISPTGSIDWWCPPQYDADAVFARLLGGEEHGCWSLAPTGPDGSGTPPPASRRRYLDGTLILVTEWDTPDGTVRVLDLMPPHTRDDTPVQLIRTVQSVRGRVRMRSDLAVRPGYGSRLPRIRGLGDRFRLHTGQGNLWFDAQPPTQLDGASLISEFTVTAGQPPMTFTLTWQDGFPVPPVPDTDAAFAATLARWQDFSAQHTHTGPGHDTLRRSLITLKALTHAPTGAVVAAPTTSLPEEIGGSRNWDYRYCWLRDSALTIAALARNGHLEEARAWRSWLVRTLTDARPMQIMYGVSGERDLPERELGHLPGYAGSAPVRVGNRAAGPLQLDVFGEVNDALDTARRHGLEPDPRADALQMALVRNLAEVWQEPDEGIWEVRGERRHFVHSKATRYATPSPLHHHRQRPGRRRAPRTRGRLPRLLVLARRSPRTDRPHRPGPTPSSRGSSPCEATSACSPRNGTPSAGAGSATTRRASPTGPCATHPTASTPPPNGTSPPRAPHSPAPRAAPARRRRSPPPQAPRAPRAPRSRRRPREPAPPPTPRLPDRTLT